MMIEDPFDQIPLVIPRGRIELCYSPSLMQLEFGTLKRYYFDLRLSCGFAGMFTGTEYRNMDLRLFSVRWP